VAAPLLFATLLFAPLLFATYPLLFATLLFAPLLFASYPLLFATNASLSAPIKRPFYCEMMDQWLHNHHRGRWQPISGESIFSHISNPF